MRTVLTATAAALALLACAGTASAAGVTLSISCGAVGQELQACQEGVNAWAKSTGNTVKIISTPNSSTERLTLYQQQLAAGSSDFDVLQIDVIWPGILKNYLLDLSHDVDKARLGQYFQPMIDNDTVDGKLVALPWFTDAGILYYRKDLLDKYGEKPPVTWSDLSRIAAKIQDGERKAGNADMQGFVF